MANRAPLVVKDGTVNELPAGDTLTVEQLRLNGSTSGYVGLAPAAEAGSVTYTLPSADGSNGQVLSTNGSGTLSWATASGGGGSGDVVGPASATDNAIVRYDGTTGKLVQDSGVTIDDDGRVGIGGAIPGDHSYYADSLVIQDPDGHGGITLVGDPDASGYGSIHFSDGSGSGEELRGYIDYDFANDRMTFAVNGANFLRVNSSRAFGVYGSGSTSFGSAGQVLTSNGSSAPPSWATVSSGSGDVVGPASATDNAIVRYDGTTGKLVQNSTVQIDDSGNLLIGTLSPNASNTGYGASNKILALESDSSYAAVSLRTDNTEVGALTINGDLNLVAQDTANLYVISQEMTVVAGATAKLQERYADVSGNRNSVTVSSSGVAIEGLTQISKGALRLSGSTSGYVGLAPAAAAGSTTYTLPSADGTSGQVLSTDGSGTLSWTDPGSGGSGISLAEARKVASLRL